MLFTAKQIRTTIYELCKDCYHFDNSEYCDLGCSDDIIFTKDEVTCNDRSTTPSPISIPWYYTSKPE